MSTAAVVIIGNEILSGKFADENAPYLIARLRELGVDLGRVTVIPDEMDVIVAEVRAAAARFDHVFTTGGVGPTHDDITMPAIARAFEVPLMRHPELERIIAAKLGADAPAAAFRMAEIPEGAALWWDGGVRFPLVVKENVAIFPGVPALLKLKFEAVAHRFAGTPVTVRRVWTSRSEPEIADRLTEAAARWPGVAIGSYPRFELSPPKVLVTLESRDETALVACTVWVAEGVGAEP
jgi:molybdenum cofactor synthesis domain-containing protein